MISRLLFELKKYLSAEFADLSLPSPEKNAEGKEIVRAPQVFVGDFPAKRQGGQDVREFPCLLLTTVAGYAEGGEEIVDVAALVCVYHPEEGDAEGLEMSLALVQSRLSRALRRCLHTPLDERFLLVRDEKGRTLRWQRGGDPTMPRPFAQVTVVSRWLCPGWE